MDSGKLNSQAVEYFAEQLFASQGASFLTIALFTLMIYEYVITFEEERKNFWKGPFSVSHGLFFFNRYFSLVIVSITVLLYTSVTPSDEVCRNTIRGSFYATAFGIGVIQAILITRVWYLFPGNRASQFGLIFSFIVSFISTFIFLLQSLSHLVILPVELFHNGHVSQSGCHASRPPMFWMVYLPSLVLHTGLYLMTVYQSMCGSQCSTKRDLRRLLITDGSLFYLIVLASILFTAVGSILKDVPQLNTPAIFSPVVLCTTSIATSRIMFGLRSLFLKVETNLNWETTTVLASRHVPKKSIAESFCSTIVSTPLQVYNAIKFGSPHTYHDPIESEKGRLFDLKIASL